MFTRSHAPRELQVWRRAQVPESLSYAALAGEPKEVSLRTLLEDQGWLCAYCMSEIDLDSASIEHYVPQSDADRGEDLSLDWHNWLAVCFPKRPHDNREGLSDHCDKSRGNTPLLLRTCATLPPATPVRALSAGRLRRYEVEGLIRYDLNGKISMDREAATAHGFTGDEITDLNEEISATLNLNHPWLRDKRKAAIQEAITILNRRKTRDWSTAEIRAEIERQRSPRQSGRLRPYAEAVIYLLQRRAQR